MRYATRNHAFVPAVTWVLNEDGLQFEDGKGPPRVVRWTEVEQVRLEFAPTRPEPNRFRCRLTLRNKQTLEFFNRTYRGVYDFEDTSTEYAAFVHELHLALVRHAPACRFVAGSTPANYALGVFSILFIGLIVTFVTVFLFLNGLAWLILIKLVLIAVFLPNVIRWLARNKPRAYPPGEIPSTVVPQLRTT